VAEVHQVLPAVHWDPSLVVVDNLPGPQDSRDNLLASDRSPDSPEADIPDEAGSQVAVGSRNVEDSRGPLGVPVPACTCGVGVPFVDVLDSPGAPELGDPPFLRSLQVHSLH